MPKIEPFERHTEDYERWFELHPGFYQSELALLKLLINKSPPSAVEIGVGSGRFAAPLKIPYGVDPSPKMLKKAIEKGLKVTRGVAENLPLKSNRFDLSLMVTTICFVDNPLKSFAEAARILKSKGVFTVGFVDKNSPLGKLYQAKKQNSKFYRPATFFSTEEILQLGRQAGFEVERVLQTIFDTEDKSYPVKEGYGEGSFVGILFKKP